MIELLVGCALFLLVNIAASFLFLLRTRSLLDRLLAAQLAGTIGAGICLLMGEAMAIPAARDVALIISGLAPLTAVAFARRYLAETH